MVIVDDEALVREGLIQLFRTLPELSIVATGHDHDRAYAALPNSYSSDRRTVALIDSAVGGVNLFDVVRFWRRHLSNVAVVMLDDGVRDYRLRHALSLQVSYATKRDHFEDVATVVLRTAAGEQSFSNEAKRRVVEGPFGWELRSVAGPPGLHFLTPRETEVLIHLAEGLTIKQCSELLNISASTVDNHKSRVMKKLRIHKMVELVRFAMREGLVSR